MTTSQPSAGISQPRVEPSPTTAWTAARIQALGTVTTVPSAAAIFGLSRSVAYDLVKTGQFPVPVLRFGTRYRIPVAAILTALHLPLTGEAATGDLTSPRESRVDRRHENSRPATAATGVT